jgi:hypothetical protein
VKGIEWGLFVNGKKEACEVRAKRRATTADIEERKGSEKQKSQMQKVIEQRL